MSGTVMSWDQDLGALHVRKESGTEVVVPVVDQTEIQVGYADIASGNLFAEGDRVRVSQEGDGPLRVEVLPEPDLELDDEPRSEPIRDEMEGAPSPTPVASESPAEIETELTPEPSPSPEPAASPEGNENSIEGT